MALCFGSGSGSEPACTMLFADGDHVHNTGTQVITLFNNEIRYLNESIKTALTSLFQGESRAVYFYCFKIGKFYFVGIYIKKLEIKVIICYNYKTDAVA